MSSSLFVLILRLVVIVICLTAGVYFLVSPEVVRSQFWFSMLFFAYAALRTFRLVQDYKKYKHNRS